MLFLWAGPKAMAHPWAVVGGTGRDSCGWPVLTRSEAGAGVSPLLCAELPVPAAELHQVPFSRSVTASLPLHLLLPFKAMRYPCVPCTLNPWGGQWIISSHNSVPPLSRDPNNRPLPPKLFIVHFSLRFWVTAKFGVGRNQAAALCDPLSPWRIAASGEAYQATT